MSNLSLNEQAALQFVFEFIPLKDLLTSAMNGFSNQTDVHSKDNEDVCYKAIAAFLK